MIIDVHGHYTITPEVLEEWRKRQIAGIKSASAKPKVGDAVYEGNARRVFSRLDAALKVKGK